MSVPALAAFMRQEASWGTDGLGELSQLLGKRQVSMPALMQPSCGRRRHGDRVWQEASWGQSQHQQLLTFSSVLLSDSQSSLYKSFKIMRYYKNSLHVSSDCTNT